MNSYTVYNSKMEFLGALVSSVKFGFNYYKLFPNKASVEFYNKTCRCLCYGSYFILLSLTKNTMVLDIRKKKLRIILDGEEFYIMRKRIVYVRLAPERYQPLQGKLEAAVNCFNSLQKYPKYVYTASEYLQKLQDRAKDENVILKWEGKVLHYCGAKVNIDDLPPMRIESKNGYLCTTWQGFLQQFIINLSIGYYWVHSYRIEKYKRWTKCDRVIMEKFQTDIGKDARYRRKKAGKANYLYLRYRDLIVIMRNEGEICEHEKEGGFVDIRRKPFHFRPVNDGELKLLVRYSGRDFSLFLSKNCYRDIRIKIRNFIRCHDVRAAIATFNALNGIPCYAGMIFDKRRMLKYILKLAREHHIKLNRDDFRINTRLKIRKVYDDDPENIVAT